MRRITNHCSRTKKKQHTNKQGNEECPRITVEEIHWKKEGWQNQRPKLRLLGYWTSQRVGSSATSRRQRETMVTSPTLEMLPVYTCCRRRKESSTCRRTWWSPVTHDGRAKGAAEGFLLVRNVGGWPSQSGSNPWSDNPTYRKTRRQWKASVGEQSKGQLMLLTTHPSIIVLFDVLRLKTTNRKTKSLALTGLELALINSRRKARSPVKRRKERMGRKEHYYIHLTSPHQYYKVHRLTPMPRNRGQDRKRTLTPGPAAAH